MNKKLKTAGRQLTYMLRHNPSPLTTNTFGYVLVIDICKTLNITIDELTEIVMSDGKQRFSFLENKKLIRASQGHSFDVDLGLPPITPPITLYHGTVKDSIALILNSGIKKMKRHAVHLSSDLKTATQVASRHKSETVILTINTKQMFEDGYIFNQSENGVWLTDFVPSEYIQPPKP